jgi:hypothetical protein
MAHPTCALARHPIGPAVAEHPCDSARICSATVSTQAVEEIDALRTAYRAAACIRSLVAAARPARHDDSFTTPADLGVLVNFVNAEFERRLQLAKAAIGTMQSP